MVQREHGDLEMATVDEKREQADAPLCVQLLKGVSRPSPRRVSSLEIPQDRLQIPTSRKISVGFQISTTLPLLLMAGGRGHWRRRPLCKQRLRLLVSWLGIFITSSFWSLLWDFPNSAPFPRFSAEN